MNQQRIKYLDDLRVIGIFAIILALILYTIYILVIRKILKVEV